MSLNQVPGRFITITFDAVIHKIKLVALVVPTVFLETVKRHVFNTINLVIVNNITDVQVTSSYDVNDENTHIENTSLYSFKSCRFLDGGINVARDVTL